MNGPIENIQIISRMSGQPVVGVGYGRVGSKMTTCLRIEFGTEAEALTFCERVGNDPVKLAMEILKAFGGVVTIKAEETGPG